MICIHEILVGGPENHHELKEGVIEDTDESMNSYGLELLCQETGFLQRFAEWDSTNWSNEVAEPEYDLVRQLIQQHPELLKTQTETEKDRNMLV